jgi:hypothetical protein
VYRQDTKTCSDKCRQKLHRDRRKSLRDAGQELADRQWLLDLGFTPFGDEPGDESLSLDDCSILVVPSNEGWNVLIVAPNVGCIECEVPRRGFLRGDAPGP